MTVPRDKDKNEALQKLLKKEGGLSQVPAPCDCSVSDLRELYAMWRETAKLHQAGNMSCEARVYYECADDLDKLLAGNKSPIERIEKPNVVNEHFAR